MSEVADSGLQYHGYIVFKNGDCFSLRGRKLMKKLTNPQGYHQYCLFINGKYRKIGVHRLLAIVYIPNPDNKEVVNHKDGVRTNNSLDNLEWFTQKENVRDGYDRMRRNEILPHKSKLTKESVIDIYKMLSNGLPTIAISKKHSVSLGAIREINNCKTWSWLANKCGFKKVTLKKGRTLNLRLKEINQILGKEEGKK